MNGDIPIAGDSAVSAILPDGEKMLGLKFLKHDIEMVHAASYDCDARLELMDAMGVSRGIVYPKSVERVRDAIGNLDAATQKRILQDNAAELYKIDV